VTRAVNAAQAIVVILGALTFVFAGTQALMGKSWEQDRGREAPMPPGSPGGGGG